MTPRDCASAVTYRPDLSLEQGVLRLQDSVLKRLFDIAAAGVGLVFLLPFLMLVAIAVSIESPGPILFRQRRSGLNGVPFMIYKFRTMRVQEDGQNVIQATRDDCRTTRVGLFLRRTSIDELPNLINVFKGEMSLVGPRPHALSHDEYFATIIPDYSARYRTKPGLTGLAQVAGLRGGTAEVALMVARVDHDVEYIRRWSFALDVELLFRTLVAGPLHPAAY
jgi:putative colanic acid biosynthesis UDP-glucose lipid carrier transferase